MKKIETIALLGNVCRNDFGFGRVPASSASAEGEFNLVKTHILEHKVKRVDALVEVLITQDKGRFAILEKKPQNSIESTEDEYYEPNSSELTSKKSVVTNQTDLVQNQCLVCTNGDLQTGV